MNKMIFSILTLCFILSILFLIVNRETIESITYFPIDERLTINQAFTSLQTSSMPKEDKTYLDWALHSKTKYPIYLRQDVSLLFKNGYLRGVLNQWEEDAQIIGVKKRLPIQKNSYYQSISFHHGEHHEKDQITSLQQMSGNFLYVFCCSEKNQTVSFKLAASADMEALSEELRQETLKDLYKQWEAMINYYKINQENYTYIPLYDLIQYNDKPLPHLTAKQTQAVLGQLWEGLYKNYILPLSFQQLEEVKSFVPLILYENQADHLIVLYNLNSQFEKLYQKIPY